MTDACQAVFDARERLDVAEHYLSTLDGEDDPMTDRWKSAKIAHDNAVQAYSDALHDNIDAILEALTRAKARAREAAAEERERCAKLVENMDWKIEPYMLRAAAAQEVLNQAAAAIRKGGDDGQA